jgi:hypothetical protein
MAERGDDIKTAHVDAGDASSSSISENDIEKAEKQSSHASHSKDNLEQIRLEYGVCVKQHPTLKISLTCSEHLVLPN